jgi:AP-2 complex subunit alpha
LAKVVRLLDRLVRTQDVPPDYLYYSLPSPWMQARHYRSDRHHFARRAYNAAYPAFVAQQIKCMRILQQFPLADDPSLAGAVSAVLQRIIAVCALRSLRSRPLYDSMLRCHSSVQRT